MPDGTRCPACDFLNHYDANVSAVEGGPIFCNGCQRMYYAGTVAEASALLESSQIQWRRDWDAIAVGAIIGFVVDALAEWLF